MRRGKRPFPSTTLFIVALLLLSFWLRLHNIDAFSFWTDEGLTPLRSGYPIAEILSNRILIQEGLTTDTHPPLFFLIIHFSRQLFGETDFAFRFPSTLASVLLVPLLVQFGRRLGGKRLGVVVGMLTAVNPLQIYYANEARMYAIFVLLAAIATYILWRTIELDAKKKPFSLLRQIVLYALFAGLALYTQYTAVFLIAAHALFWVWLLWRRGQKKLIVGTAVITILAIIPLIPYTIPRLFKGAEANFYYVSPWVMLQDVVRFFGLGFTVDFNQPFIQLSVIALAGLLFLGIYAAKSSWRRLFLSSYLLAAVFGLMAGSYLFKPMYQGARHIMIGSPAFILLIGLGMVKVKDLTGFIEPKVRNLSGLVGLVLTAVTLISTTLSVHNLYNDPIYAKDNFRDMIQFVEQTAGDNDVIVYNNAILLPLHNHYQKRDDILVTASPIYPTYAVNTAVPQLQQLAQEYDRIWFITDPPADRRDEKQLVKKWLDDNLMLIKSYPFPARTTALSAIVYDTAPQHVEQLPSEVQWTGFPTLRGIKLNFNQPVTMPTFWVDLFWQGGTAPPQDVMLKFSLIGPDGQLWATANPPLILEPIAAPDWQNEGLIRLSYPIQLPIGIPPGSYTLDLQSFDANETEMGNAKSVAEIILADSGGWAAVSKQPALRSSKWPFFSTAPLIFNNGLSLQAIQLADIEVRPGHALPMTLFWQTNGTTLNLNNIQYQLELRSPDGTMLRQQKGSPSPSWLSQWPPNTLIRENSGLYFAPETEPGRYLLYWQLLDGETAVSGKPAWRPWATQTIQLGEIMVIPWPLETSLPEETSVVQAQFGERIQLYGYDLMQTDEQLTLTLYWQATAVPTQNYTLFVHLLDQNGNIISQQDTIPVDGLRPTKGWRNGEVLRDTINLPLPEIETSGEYQLIIGLYLPETGERPSLTQNGTPQPNNQLLLRTITLP